MPDARIIRKRGIMEKVGGSVKRTQLLKKLSIGSLMDLKIDFAFKQLFGIEKNKEITIVFLNAILQRTGRHRIKDISFGNIEAGGAYEDDKQSRLDLLVKTDTGEYMNVEIQFSNQYDMVKRSIYYWAGIYRTPLEKRMSYKELNSVIAINILNFDLFSKTERFHTTYHLYEDTEKFKLTDVLARWLLMLGMVDRRNGKVYEDIFKELGEIAMKDETLREAFENWEVLSGTKEDLLAYESRLKRILDDEAALREAELREQEARQEGLREGEQKAKEETARRLLAKGMDVNMVAEVTGLSEEEVNEIVAQTN